MQVEVSDTFVILFTAAVLPLLSFAICPWLYFWILGRIGLVSPFDVAGKVIVVTGACGGLGSCLVKTLVEATEKAHDTNTTLVLIDRDLAALTTLQKQLQAGLSRTKVAVYKCDFNNTSEVSRVAEKIKQDLPTETVDVLINNAGIVTGKPLAEASMESIQSTFRVNTMAQFALLKAYLPDMISKNEGLVVTVSSLMGLLGSPRLSTYCATKWALLGMNESLRLEVKQVGASNVRFLSVCPYAINTGMFNGIFEGDGWSLWFIRKVFPLLTAESVSSRIFQAMVDGESHVVIPTFMSILPAILHSLPVPVMDGFLKVTGISRGMDTFKSQQMQDCVEQ